MHTRISRWGLGVALSIAVTVGGAMFGTMPAHGQPIDGLGQADQTFNRCHTVTSDDDWSCNDHNAEHGGKGRQ